MVKFGVIPILGARELVNGVGRGKRFKGDQADPVDRLMDVHAHLGDSAEREEENLENDLTAEAEYAAVHRELIDLWRDLGELAQRNEHAGGMEWIVRRELLLLKRRLAETLNRFAKARERDEADDAKQAAQIAAHEETQAACRRTCIKFSEKEREHEGERGSQETEG